MFKEVLIDMFVGKSKGDRNTFVLILFCVKDDTTIVYRYGFLRVSVFV